MLDNRNSIYVLRRLKPVCSSAVSGGNAFHLQVVLPAQPEKKKLHPAQCQDIALLKHIPNVSSIAAGRVAKALPHTLSLGFAVTQCLPVDVRTILQKPCIFYYNLS